MAGTLGIYWSFGGTANGVAFVGPDTSMVDPVNVVSIDGTYTLFRTVTIPVTTAAHPYPDPTEVWNWEDGGEDFSLMAFQVTGDTGSVAIWWKADKPTSATDYTPLGTHEVCGNRIISCNGPDIWTLPDVYVHDTLATAAGVDGDGFPSGATASGRTLGRIYKVWATNTSTETAAQLNIWIKQ